MKLIVRRVTAIQKGKESNESIHCDGVICVEKTKSYMEGTLTSNFITLEDENIYVKADFEAWMS